RSSWERSRRTGNLPAMSRRPMRLRNSPGRQARYTRSTAFGSSYGRAAEQMTDRLDGRIALITGASRGIGRAVALAIAREGAHVVLLARTQGALEEVDDEIREAGGSATLLQLELRSGDEVDALGTTLFQRWGKLGVLVGNAGIVGALSPLGHITADAWSDVINITLTANWRLIRTCD